jgi:uncharacterized membrane protein SpoIIM required for sporulation
MAVCVLSVWWELEILAAGIYRQKGKKKEDTGRSLHVKRVVAGCAPLAGFWEVFKIS